MTRVIIFGKVLDQPLSNIEKLHRILLLLNVQQRKSTQTYERYRRIQDPSPHHTPHLEMEEVEFPIYHVYCKDFYLYK